MKIIHLSHNQIDFERWDLVISACKNRMIYAQSWYLNVVSPQWEALVSEDYAYLMPLPVKQKWGIKYIVQPPMTQQLGLFSADDIDIDILQKFIKNIPYLSYEINLNEANLTDVAENRLNLLLHLDEDYSVLKKGFSNNTLRNIKKGFDLNPNIDKQLSVDEFIHFYENTTTHYNKMETKLIKVLFEKATEKGALSIFATRNENKAITSAVCMWQAYDRLVNILPVSNEEGKSNKAMFLLMDTIIKEHANSKLILDFEGSMLDGVARFYRGFGAKEAYYGVIKRFRPQFLIGRV